MWEVRRDTADMNPLKSDNELVTEEERRKKEKEQEKKRKDW